MQDYKLPKDTYSAARYAELHFAVAHYGTAMHRNLWDLMVDTGASKRQIFNQYMKVLRTTSAVNHDIIVHVVVGKKNMKKWLASISKNS
jgi:hypothetical protein